MATESYDRAVWDVHSTCDALWVSRGEEFTPAVLAAVLNSATPVETAQRLHADKVGGSSWLGVNGWNDIVACSWSKDTVSPAGVWSLTLKPRQDYLARIRPGDLIFLFMADDRLYDLDLLFAGKLITVGLVDRVSMTVQVEQATEQRVVMLTGRDLGAIFQETSTVFDPSFAAIPQFYFNSKYLTGVLTKQSAISPLENVLLMLDLVYNSQATGSLWTAMQWLLHSQGGNKPLVSLIDATTFVQAPLFGYALPKVIALAQAGNMWTLLETNANKLINELFVDVRDFVTEEGAVLTQLGDTTAQHMDAVDVELQRAARSALSESSVFRSAFSRNLVPSGNPSSAPQVMALVFRQMPYDRDAFMALPQRTVWLTEAYDLEVGYSGQEVFNYLKVSSPALSAEFTELTYGITINMDAVTRFGLRRLEAQTQYFYANRSAAASRAGTQPTAFQSVFDYYVGLYSVWYAANDKLLSGTLTTRLRPDIRVGHRLRLHYSEDHFVDFYVQALHHTFHTQEGGSRSQFTIVRGIPSTATGIEANLRWTGSGPAIPATMNPYARFSAFGLDLVSGSGVKIVSEQRAPVPDTTTTKEKP
jgi:hypothetical protein